MGHQMTERQRDLVTFTIQNVNPCPQDIDDCVVLLENKKIFTMKKAKTFWDEFLQVCQQAIDARPPSPPRSTISPPSPADPVPGTLHGDGALRAAARDSRDKDEVGVHLAIGDSCLFANAKFTNTEFSYIRENIVKEQGLQCSDGIVQIRWKDPTFTADHAVLATVLILVSEEEASKVEMKVNIFFGNRCRDEHDAQLQAVYKFMDIPSASLPSEVQPDESCAGSVAEAASLPPQALESIPSQSSCVLVIIGPDAVRQATNVALQHEAARLSGALRREAQVSA